MRESILQILCILLISVTFYSLPVAASEDPIAWRSVADGEEEARFSDRLVLYFFTADWCAPCVTLKDDVFSHPVIAKEIREHYIPVEVKDRRREEGQNPTDVDRVQLRFFVEGFPTMVVARPDNGHGVTETGMLSGQGMLDFLVESPARLAELERKSARRRR